VTGARPGDAEAAAPRLPAVPVRANLFVDRCDAAPSLVGSRDRETGLVAWTVVARGLPGFDSPYALGTIALDAGPSFIGQLHDWQGKALRAGMRVRLAIGRIKNEKDGTEVVGPKFVPVED
jgi:uncharacterized OB-fold protein